MNRKRQPKIVVIGAASSSFSGLLADLVGNKQLNGAELALVDIDAPGLETMTALGRRMAKQWHSKTTVAGTTDRREALAGADFVLTTIAVGGVKTWQQDQQIPLRHGYHGHAVDTVGPGGLFRGLRLIPPTIEICKDVERICPDAWVINYSNPMAAVCRAVRKTTNVNIVGLCTAGFLPGQIARYLDIDPARVEVVSAGVNHLVWALKILVDGQDFTEQFKDRMRRDQAAGYARSSLELMEVFGHWPMPGPSHVAEFFPYFYGRGDDGRDEPGRYQYRHEINFDKRLEKDAKLRADLKAQAEEKAPIGHEPEETAAEAVRMILSIWLNRRTLHYANLPNEGLVANLPDSVVGLMQARCAYNELLAEAAVRKSKHVALRCLVADTLTTSITKARACVEEMFAAQAEFLTGYH